MSGPAQAPDRAIRLAGIDGCRGGWIVVVIELRRGRFHRAAVKLVRRIEAAIRARPRPRVTALDMPIGLPNRLEPGGRRCDRLARRLLGRPRSSSVFSPPTRRQLADGLTLLRLPQGLTKQTFHILSKIQEVDAFLRPRDQARVVEAHPELALARLAGRPMRWNKKTRNGRRERLRALARLPLAWRRGLAPILKGQGADLARTDVAPDDILDAAALAWTAWRVYGGTAIRLPQDPPKDRRGLRMEILY